MGTPLPRIDANMGIIERSVEVSGQRKKRIKALFDSGSSFSIIKKSIIKEIGYLKIGRTNIKLQLGNGQIMKVSQYVILGVKLNKNEYFHKFLIAEIPEQMIIGVDFLQEFGHTLEFKNDKIIAKNQHLKTIKGVYRL